MNEHVYLQNLSISWNSSQFLERHRHFSIARTLCILRSSGRSFLSGTARVKFAGIPGAYSTCVEFTKRIVTKISHVSRNISSLFRRSVGIFFPISPNGLAQLLFEANWATGLVKGSLVEDRYRVDIKKKGEIRPFCAASTDACTRGCSRGNFIRFALDQPTIHAGQSYQSNVSLAICADKKTRPSFPRLHVPGCSNFFPIKVYQVFHRKDSPPG